jgi:hypothetical protein
MEFNSKYETPQYTTNDIIEVHWGDLESINSKVSKEGSKPIFIYEGDPIRNQFMLRSI